MPVGVGGRQAAPAAPAAAPAGKPAAAPAGAPAGSGGGGLKKLVMILVIVLVIAALAGGTFVTLKLLGVFDGKQTQQMQQTQQTQLPPVTEPLAVGQIAVSTGEGMNINLDDGRFLAFAATVYFDESVEESVEDSAPARDAAYQLFKGMKVEDLDKPSAQKELQEKYLKLLNEESIPPWNGHVAAVRFDMFTHD